MKEKKIDRTEVKRLLKELNEKDGLTIIMVTHESWSLRDAKKIFYMKDGEIVKMEKSAPKTVAESVSKHIYKELSPKLPASELAAQTLSSLLLRGYSVDEIRRFQFYLLQRFKDYIDKDTFLRVLDRPYKDGGLGLWKPKAIKITDYVEEIIEHKREIDEIYMELEKNPETPLFAEIENIRDWLLKSYKGKISGLQKIQFNEIITERLRAIIDAEQFQKIISLSKNKFGIGLSFRTAQKISEKMETILKSENHKLNI